MLSCFTRAERDPHRGRRWHCERATSTHYECSGSRMSPRHWSGGSGSQAVHSTREYGAHALVPVNGWRGEAFELLNTSQKLV